MRRPPTRETGSMDTGISCAMMIVIAVIAIPHLVESSGRTLPTWGKAAIWVVGLLLAGAAVRFGDSGGFASNISNAELEDLQREYESPGTDDPPSG